MHNPRVIESKQLSNELVAYCLQCCDDEFEKTWHTIHILSPDHAGQLEERKKEIAVRHEAMVAWRKGKE